VTFGHFFFLAFWPEPLPKKKIVLFQISSDFFSKIVATLSVAVFVTPAGFKPTIVIARICRHWFN
jgi:hypothetical protein